jgi:DNA-binding MarR family transcriptional regulator
MKMRAGKKPGPLTELTPCIYTVYGRLMQDDFSQCMVTNSRMAARAITRRYDEYLRPHGLTSTQLSLIAGILTMRDRTVSDMAEARGFERTTLTRNLDRLEAMGLIASRPAKTGNGRVCDVTPKGRAILNELAPLWRKAQSELRAALTPDGFDATLSVLRRLASI